eukprot:GEMP01034660.1.p1 GENE.GEMP01034660.1~~GEMP01034660.1.p1  ORF type:complete len:269 (+),score=64.15 GEMP01034660.1:126-932(+)
MMHGTRQDAAEVRRALLAWSGGKYGTEIFDSPPGNAEDDDEGPKKSAQAAGSKKKGKKQQVLAVPSGRYSEIIPGLYLGNKDAAEVLTAGASKNGKLMSEKDRSVADGLVAVANLGGGKLVHPNTWKAHIADSDDASLLPAFPDACAFIDKHYCDVSIAAVCVEPKKNPLAGKEREEVITKGKTKDGVVGNVLVHCRAGMRRSPTLVCAFLIYKYRFSTDEALRVVKAARPIANPGQGQIIDLRTWEAEQKAKEEVGTGKTQSLIKDR